MWSGIIIIWFFMRLAISMTSTHNHAQHGEGMNWLITASYFTFLYLLQVLKKKNFLLW